MQKRPLGPGEITVWGTGCESKPWTKLELTPMGDGSWIEITMQGDDRQAPELRELRTAHLALDDDETTHLIGTLSNQALEGRPLPVDDATHAGAITVNFAGALDAHIGELTPGRLTAIADVVLDLAGRAGLVASDAFHPLGSLAISPRRSDAN